MNLVAIPRYRASLSWLMHLACGHYRHTDSYLVAGLGYLKCVTCDGIILVNERFTLESTWP